MSVKIGAGVRKSEQLGSLIVDEQIHDLAARQRRMFQPFTLHVIICYIILCSIAVLRIITSTLLLGILVALRQLLVFGSLSTSPDLYGHGRGESTSRT